MELVHTSYENGNWDKPLDKSMDSEKTLVIIFSTYDAGTMQTPLQELQEAYPSSHIVGASTAGTIYMDMLEENNCSVTIAKFNTTDMKLVTTSIKDMQESRNEGKKLATKLNDESLRYVLILSNGLHTNGSELVDGFNEVFESQVPTSGALAADDGKFESTWVIVDGKTDTHGITAVGFYGEDIRYTASSQDGLDIFGIQRLVTRSEANVLYELDGKPALEIYKKYLGDQAQKLPLSALSFPLSLATDSNDSITRTIIGVNYDENSMTFAGDIPQGSYVSFMKANLDRIIAGANEAATELHFEDYDGESVLSIAISCIGRKAVLKQRTEEELESVLEAMPKNTLQIGMYSFGEISPTQNRCCELHNQTMTLTAIWEKDA